MAIATKNSAIENLKVGTTNNSYLRDLFLILLGSFLLAISAQYKVPFFPVPATLQSLVVMMIGSLYGWRLGAATIFAYWIEGILVGGLFSFIPWFANGSGLGYFLMSPTAGFLWGFLPMVLIIGYCSEVLYWRNNPFMIFLGLILGQVALYGFGLAQAYIWILPSVTWMNSPKELLILYLYPFLYGDIIKSIIASIITFGFYKKFIRV